MSFKTFENLVAEPKLYQMKCWKAAFLQPAYTALGAGYRWWDHEREGGLMKKEEEKIQDILHNGMWVRV